MTQPLPLTMPAHFHHAPSFAQVRAELAREAEARRRLYPDRIAKGRMSSEEAAYELAVIGAIAQDLEWVIAIAVPSLATERQAFSWADKRRALHRELDYRARLYPDWIAKGRLVAADAAHRTACLHAMLALYDDGLTWRPDPPDAPPATRRAQWAQTMAAIAGQDATAQKELTL